MTYDDLLRHFGSQAEAARALDLQPPSVSEWQATTIPYPRQCQIEVVTGGKLIARKKDDARLRREARAA